MNEGFPRWHRRIPLHNRRSIPSCIGTGRCILLILIQGGFIFIMYTQEKARTHLRTLLLMSLFMALSIIFGKFLAFNAGEMLRISFENLPILLAGVFLGPIAGLTVAVGADLVGCVLVGYAINPVVTLGAAAIGLVSGALARLTRRLPLCPRTLLTVLASHLIGSVLIKTAGLAAFYGVSYPVLMLWRTLNYLLVGGLEGVLLYVLLKSTVSDALDKLLCRKTKKEGHAE